MDRPETAHIRSNGQLTLPIQVRRASELQEGDVVEVVPQSDGTILLRPIAVLDRQQADQMFRRGHGPAAGKPRTICVTGSVACSAAASSRSPPGASLTGWSSAISVAI